MAFYSTVRALAKVRQYLVYVTSVDSGVCFQSQTKLSGHCYFGCFTLGTRGIFCIKKFIHLHTVLKAATVQSSSNNGCGDFAEDTYNHQRKVSYSLCFLCSWIEHSAFCIFNISFDMKKSKVEPLKRKHYILYIWQRSLGHHSCASIKFAHSGLCEEE